MSTTEKSIEAIKAAAQENRANARSFRGIATRLADPEAAERMVILAEYCEKRADLDEWCAEQVAKIATRRMRGASS